MNWAYSISDSCPGSGSREAAFCCMTMITCMTTEVSSTGQAS